MVRETIAITGEKYPFVDVTITVTYRDQIVTLTKNCWVDTGFNGDVVFPLAKTADLELIGLNLKDTPVGLAGEVAKSAKICLANITKINSHDFSVNEMEISALFMGTSNYGLLGLNALRRWISKFDGPKKVLSISEP